MSSAPVPVLPKPRSRRKNQAATKISASTRPSATVTCPRLAMPDGAVPLAALGAPNGRETAAAVFAAGVSAACCASAVALHSAPASARNTLAQIARATRAGVELAVSIVDFIKLLQLANAFGGADHVGEA